MSELVSIRVNDEVPVKFKTVIKSYTELVTRIAVIPFCSKNIIAFFEYGFHLFLSILVTRFAVVVRATTPSPP
jgi:hypothetical protein